MTRTTCCVYYLIKLRCKRMIFFYYPNTCMYTCSITFLRQLKFYALRTTGSLLKVNGKTKKKYIENH